MIHTRQKADKTRNRREVHDTDLDHEGFFIVVCRAGDLNETVSEVALGVMELFEESRKESLILALLLIIHLDYKASSKASTCGFATPKPTSRTFGGSLIALFMRRGSSPWLQKVESVRMFSEVNLEVRSEPGRQFTRRPSPRACRPSSWARRPSSWACCWPCVHTVER